MGGFANVQALGDALLAGRSTYATWRKSPSQVSTAGVWFDLSMSPGNPAPQYYAASPMVARTLTQSADGGLFHGGAVAPASKHLSRVTALTTTATALPLPMILCDYLLFYPFVDEGSTDEQPMDNTTTLPRYTDGAGVQVMAVSVAGRTGGQTFRFTYTNSAGVSGRVSQTVIQNTAAANGNIVTSQNANNSARGPFIPLQAGDTGVRSASMWRVSSDSHLAWAPSPSGAKLIDPPTWINTQRYIERHNLRRNLPASPYPRSSPPPDS